MTVNKSALAVQLAIALRNAEQKLWDAQAIASAAGGRLPRLLHSGDQAKIVACKERIAASNILITGLTQEAEALRDAVKLAEADEIEAANTRSFEAISKAVTKAAEATKALDALVVQFGAAITEWSECASAANHALQCNGISLLRDSLSLASILNLLNLNLYVATEGQLGKSATIDNLHQLRQNIATGGYASLVAAAETYKA